MIWCSCLHFWPSTGPLPSHICVRTSVKLLVHLAFGMTPTWFAAAHAASYCKWCRFIHGNEVHAAAGMQMLFRSVNKLLIDTATTEYLFCVEFFQEDAVFNELFAASLAVVESALSAQLQAGLHAQADCQALQVDR